MEHVGAVLRVRPLLAREVERGEKTSLVVQPDGRRVQVTTPITRANQNQVQMFDMDRCLSPEMRQKEIFEALEIGKMCDAAFEGKAATVMCFGQTGSGKTYTMSGPSGESGGEAMESGIQFEAARYVAEARERLLAVDDGGAKTVTVRASYVELFNERINDMLNGTEGLKCRWSKDANCFFVEDLMVVECLDLNDLLLVLREGQARRKRAAHLLNDDSSRSHLLFTIYVEVGVGDKPVRYGKLTFVDLAGSERLRDTGSASDDSKSINRSLFALGNVIERLSRSHLTRQRDHIPYRSSVLTQLLMNSLDGSCRTLLVACVTPSSRFVDESLRTIYFAQRAQKIRCHTVERVDATQQEVYDLKLEIKRLREENVTLRRALGLPDVGPVVLHTLGAPSRALPIKKDNTVSTHRVERKVAAIGRNRSPVVRDDVSIPFSDLQERRTREVLESPRGSSRGCHSAEPLPCETALDVLQRLPNSSGLLAQKKPLPLGKLVPVQTQLVPKNLGFQILQKKKRLFEL